MVGVSFLSFLCLKVFDVFVLLVKVFGVVIGFAMVGGYTRVACQRLNQTTSFD